ncbi:MAG: glutathionylspermidine synthase family protein [Caulobacteraceae bacterium]|nr:glutathionylspermidine synthase family protein [Caulobacteraceae bacterium]
MDRVSLTPRPDWRAAVEARGLAWHTGDDGQPYWDESAYWRFTAEEIDRIEAATETLYGLCLEGIERLVGRGDLGLWGYDPTAIALIEQSWRERDRHPSLYARFDLAFDGRDLKLLELNGDTPTSLVEAAVVQWWWLEERFPQMDQFNSIHEGLVEALSGFRRDAPAGQMLHLTCVRPHAEDEGTIDYLAACAGEAGLPREVLGLEEIGWRTGDGPGRFVDLADREITALFKLAPWEWLLADPFGDRLASEVLGGRLRLIEPAWKMLASDKRLLASLWEMFPGHPLLLEATTSLVQAQGYGAYARKPAHGREGANVVLFEGGQAVASASGDYGGDAVVYQRRARLAHARGSRGEARYAVLGSWVIGGLARGLGVRESSGPITSNMAQFVPHLFEP